MWQRANACSHSPAVVGTRPHAVFWPCRPPPTIPGREMFQLSQYTTPSCPAEFSSATKKDMRCVVSSCTRRQVECFLVLLLGYSVDSESQLHVSSIETRTRDCISDELLFRIS